MTELDVRTAPAEELDESPEGERWLKLLDRLNDLSITKHFDAYVDVPWDDPAYALDPTDPRFELDPEMDPLGATEWYLNLPQPDRARLGCELVASKMKIGLVFENILKRGLLEFTLTLPNNSPEFRYAYHEVIEEAQHSLMFQEFVNRSGYDAPGLGRRELAGSRRIVALGRRFPQLFFLFVLGGEDPIDYVQRRELRSQREIHPLLERIMRIHVTEEARHLSFARHYLKRTVPSLSPWHRMRLAIGAPVILGTMAQLMLKPAPDLVERYAIPADVLETAYTKNPDYHRETVASLGKVRKLCVELGLVRLPFTVIWRRLGLDPRTA
jgi:hypothetical protein